MAPAASRTAAGRAPRSRANAACVGGGCRASSARAATCASSASARRTAASASAASPTSPPTGSKTPSPNSTNACSYLLKAEQDRIGREVRAVEERLASVDAHVHEWQETLKVAMHITSNCGSAYARIGDKARRLFNTAVFDRLAVPCATAGSSSTTSPRPSTSSSACLGSKTEVLWRWRESNPRPSAPIQGFSGRSLLRFSRPHRSRRRVGDRPSCCEVSRRIPQPGPPVEPPC